MPHATPVWRVWLDGALYVDGHPQTRWARDLAANPRLTVHLESGDDLVIIEGLAEDIRTDNELAGQIVSAWLDKVRPAGPGTGHPRAVPAPSAHHPGVVSVHIGGWHALGA